MLTPPSRHLKVMQQNVAESKAVADVRREQDFSARVAADRANMLARKRQKLRTAQRERDAFLVRESWVLLRRSFIHIYIHTYIHTYLYMYIYIHINNSK